VRLLRVCRNGNIQLNSVTIIVDPAYGRRLIDSPEDVPVWIVDTPQNNEGAKEARDRGMSVTTYKCKEVLDRVSNLRSTLTALETHHGQIAGDYLAFGYDSKIQVIGLARSHGAVEILREFGFRRFSDVPDGFIAAR
jgi:hypothetical protein